MRYAAVLLIFSTFFLRECRADPVEGNEYQSQSVATVDRPLSGIVNPAALGFWTSMGVEYAHTFTDSSYKGDDGLLLATKGSFFSVEWLNHDTGIFRRKYTLAIGDRMLSNFYVGVSYAWFGGSNTFYKDRKDWKFGLLYHPKPFASLALVIDRINQPRFGGLRANRLYQPGLALRPFGNKITFSADALLNEDRSITRSTGIFRIEAGPFRGVTLTTDYRTEGQWRLGLTLDIQQTRLGVQAKYYNSDNFRGGTYFIDVGAEEYNSGYSSATVPGSMILKSDIVEEPRGRSIFGPNKRSFYSVIRDIRHGADDPHINSLLLKLEDINLDFASVQELRGAMAEYHAHGKKVITYMGEAGNLEYYLASASDKIYMDPTGLLELKGLAATTRFYKGTMDKLGIKAEIVRTGPHKDFGDAFVETTLTDASREQVNWLLDDLYAQFVDSIASGRHITSDRVKTLIDDGPYTATNAYKAGLIDSLLHYDELTEDNGPYVSQINLSHLYSRPQYDPRWMEPKVIAIVYADGSIMPGESGSSLLEGKVIGSTTLTSALKDVRDNPNIKTVVFRVNSPGGDVFASEEIYHQLELLRKVKPVIVSMGGVAASGGYYISCPGDEILASPGTITGSIGVVIGKVDMSEFYQKIGINNVTLKRGRHADIRSSTRPATPEELALIDSMLWDYYGDFVNKVTTWRKLDFDSVDAIGEGRVWTGYQAKKLGLVDSFGGIFDAIEQARQKANINPADKIAIETYPMYGVSIVPSLTTPSLETQLSALFARSEDTRYYYKPPFDLKIK